MLRQAVLLEELAACCGVEPKSVERWINTDRIPHRRHRWAAARHLSVDEIYLWPAVAGRGSSGNAEATRAELVEIYPDRASVPRELWLRLLSEAQEHVDVLVFSGTFYAQTQPRVAAMVTEAAQRGAQIRLCFGDPTADSVAIRDREEGLAGTLASKIRSSLTYYRNLIEIDGCEVRLHSSTVYASLFRYDDEVLVNPHVYGEPASANPTLHFRRLGGGSIADHYITSFDRVWSEAMPWNGDHS